MEKTAYIVYDRHRVGVAHFFISLAPEKYKVDDCDWRLSRDKSAAFQFLSRREACKAGKECFGKNGFLMQKISFEDQQVFQFS